MIFGITVQLVVKKQIGVNPIGEPIYTESIEEVEDVLVGAPATDDIENVLNLYGKRVTYQLAIPKKDEHDWVDTEVILPKPFSGRYHTIGIPTAGIEENIPLRWNKKVNLEYVGG